MRHFSGKDLEFKFIHVEIQISVVCLKSSRSIHSTSPTLDKRLGVVLSQNVTANPEVGVHLRIAKDTEKMRTRFTSTSKSAKEIMECEKGRPEK